LLNFSFIFLCPYFVLLFTSFYFLPFFLFYFPPPVYCLSKVYAQAIDQTVASAVTSQSSNSWSKTIYSFIVTLISVMHKSEGISNTLYSCFAHKMAESSRLCVRGEGLVIVGGLYTALHSSPTCDCIHLLTYYYQRVLYENFSFRFPMRRLNISSSGSSSVSAGI
jgi:hypothetical protein